MFYFMVKHRATMRKNSTSFNILHKMNKQNSKETKMLSEMCFTKSKEE